MYSEKQIAILKSSNFVANTTTDHRIWLYYLTSFKDRCWSGRDLRVLPTDLDCKHVISELSFCHCKSCQVRAVEILAFGRASIAEEEDGFSEHLEKWVRSFLEKFK